MNGVEDTPGAGQSSPLGSQRAGEFVGRLWLAPGPRALELAAVLEALAPGSTVALADLYDLPQTPIATTGADTLVVDADHLALEDIGWIRRQLALGRLGGVVAVGIDPGASVARALRSLPHARWAPSPPDLDELKRWLPRGAGQSPIAGPTSAARESASATSLPTRAPSAESSAESSSQSSTESSAARFAAAQPSAQAPASSAHGDAERAALTLGRDQVAVLADISQRLELAFFALREAGRGHPAELEAAQVELRRLLRFTRSLACLAAPPPRGDDEFDVAGLLEELLATLTLRGRKGPRFQPTSGSGGRPSVEFVARADRAAVTMALETVLTLARLCSSGGDTVRVSYAPINGSALAIAVDFPAGPLHDIEPRRVLDAGVLRERLPELDPSELAAATAILHSQGGVLEFAAAGEGQLSARLRLPLERTYQRAKSGAAPAGSSGASVSVQSGGQAGSPDLLRPVEPTAARHAARPAAGEGPSASDAPARPARGSSRGDDPFA